VNFDYVNMYNSFGEYDKMRNGRNNGLTRLLINWTPRNINWVKALVVFCKFS